MNKKKLKKARMDIDQLDQKIFNLIKKRTQIVKYMLSLKKLKSKLFTKKNAATCLPPLLCHDSNGTLFLNVLGFEFLQAIKLQYYFY